MTAVALLLSIKTKGDRSQVDFAALRAFASVMISLASRVFSSPSS